MDWKGVIPALVTPFTTEDAIDLSLFSLNLDAQVAAGVKAVVLGGSLGEASTLETGEKEMLVQHVLERRDLDPIVTIAEGSTREALRQIRLAESWGAKGLMMLPPMRYKADARETIDYFQTAADATSLSIMVYNNPFDYKIEVTPEMFEELAGCRNIAAVKESTRDITNLTRMRNRFGDRFRILCGVDTIAMEELVMGADGWIAGLVNAFPTETGAVYHLVKTGRLNEARRIMAWFMPLLELDIHPKLVQYIKLAAAETGLGSEWVRAPRLILEGAERQSVLATIRKGIASRPSLAGLYQPDTEPADI